MYTHSLSRSLECVKISPQLSCQLSPLSVKSGLMDAVSRGWVVSAHWNLLEMKPVAPCLWPCSRLTLFCLIVTVLEDGKR